MIASGAAVVYVARLTARPDSADVVAELLLSMATAVARDEPGCLTYRVSRSPEHPEQFLIYEEYVDREALASHRRTRHMQEIIGAQVVPHLEVREGTEYVAWNGQAQLAQRG